MQKLHIVTGQINLKNQIKLLLNSMNKQILHCLHDTIVTDQLNVTPPFNSTPEPLEENKYK